MRVNSNISRPIWKIYIGFWVLCSWTSETLLWLIKASMISLYETFSQQDRRSMKEIPEIRTNCRYLFAEEEQHTGTAQGVGLGKIQPFPPKTFWLIKSLFFYFSKTGLSFTKSVRYIILCQIYRPLSKFSLILIGPFRSNLVFWGFSRTDTARWGSLSLGLFRTDD